MGDTLLWMGLRYHSAGQFFHDFVSADPALWYRPLAQRTIISVLYPFAGLDPIPYRVVSFLLFFACTIAVFVVTKRITESRRSAWLATLFFAPHVTHAFTTFDAAFFPEMIFTLFYIGSVICWVSWMRTGRRSAWLTSFAFLVGGLLSKETAVAVPFTLLAIWLLLPGRSRPLLRSLLPHFAILGGYVVFAVVHLHIRGIDLRQLLDQPGTAGGPGYQLVVGNNITESVKIAFSWAFGISRGIYGQWPPSAPWMLGALRIVRVVICGAALFSLFTPRRRFVLIGLAWFLIAAGPTLPLLDHFLPYYLFAPLVGFSIAVGTVLDFAYEQCARIARPAAIAFCAVLLVLMGGIQAGAARRVSARHDILGGSAEIAQRGMNDMLAMYPTLPRGITLVIFDEEHPSLYWDQAHGMVYRMAYQDESIQTEYLATEISIKGEDVNAGRALVFKLADGHLTDITAFVKQRPDLLLPHDSNMRYRIELSKPVVHAGSDFYVLHVLELVDSKDVTLNVLRAHDGVVEAPFQLTLDAEGRVEIPVGDGTKAGTYTYIALQKPGDPGWVTVSGSVRVQ